jgi:hypothetical protein
MVSKAFQTPAGSRDKKVFLEFEGIRFAGEFYLNGKFIGRHENGITALVLISQRSLSRRECYRRSNRQFLGLQRKGDRLGVSMER